MSVVPYITAPSDLSRISGGISFLSSGSATGTTMAPSLSSAKPLSRIPWTMGSIRSLTAASPSQRSKWTSRLPKSVFIAAIETSMKCCQSAR